MTKEEQESFINVYERFYVEKKNDPEGKHSECVYFVLDLTHDPYAIVALATYAEAANLKDKENLIKLAENSLKVENDNT